MYFFDEIEFFVFDISLRVVLDVVVVLLDVAVVVVVVGVVVERQM